MDSQEGNLLRRTKTVNAFNRLETSTNRLRLQSEVSDFSNVDNMPDPKQAVFEMDAIRQQVGIKELKQRALQLLSPIPGEQFLDIGCGSGEDSRAIANMLTPGGKVIGLDISNTMIEEARQRGSTGFPAAEYMVRDVHSLHFEDESIHGCWCERTLQHVRDPKQVLSEIARVLRPGGRAVLLDTDWETFVINGAEQVLTKKIVNAFRNSIANDWVGRQLSYLCSSAGLNRVEMFSQTVNSFDVDLLLNGMDFLGFLKEAEVKGIVSKIDVRRWVAELEEASANGSFFFGVTVFGMFCNRAPA